ncbi:hypothetical protein VP01_192g3 [Puccinia sorghi]|uniref:Uncharacterized protein n=1 Tax=Puccinia sorghi TaxID=27349 RepID=A0A0L6VD03_9BASI|nr:hypothetical protein VP01_192g3 [Puccinia sorghi]
MQKVPGSFFCYSKLSPRVEVGWQLVIWSMPHFNCRLKKSPFYKKTTESLPALTGRSPTIILRFLKIFVKIFNFIPKNEVTKARPYELESLVGIKFLFFLASGQKVEPVTILFFFGLLQDLTPLDYSQTSHTKERITMIQSSLQSMTSLGREKHLDSIGWCEGSIIILQRNDQYTQTKDPDLNPQINLAQNRNQNRPLSHLPWTCNSLKSQSNLRLFSLTVTHYSTRWRGDLRFGSFHFLLARRHELQLYSRTNIRTYYSFSSSSCISYKIINNLFDLLPQKQLQILFYVPHSLSPKPPSVLNQPHPFHFILSLTLPTPALVRGAASSALEVSTYILTSVLPKGTQTAVERKTVSASN